MHGDGIGTLRARLRILAGLISETPVKPAPFFSTVAAKKHVEGTASAVKPKFVELLYVHVRVLANNNSCERDHENENS